MPARIIQKQKNVAVRARENFMSYTPNMGLPLRQQAPTLAS